MRRPLKKNPHPSPPLLIAAVACLVAAFALPGAAGAHGPTAERIAELSRRIAADPGDADLLLRRAELHRAHEDYPAALADLAAAAEIDPERPDVDYFRARVLVDAGEPRRAVAALDRYLARASGRRAAAHLLRGRAWLALDRPLAAARDFRRAIRLLDRPRPEVFIDCARAFAAAGRRAAAGACLDDGLRRLGPLVSLEHWAVELELRSGRAPRSFPPSAALRERPAVPKAGVAQVTRGPYLQRATPTSLVVRWRTDVATDSRVRYGDDPANLTSSVDDLAPTTEHVVELTGLTPATTTFYAVGSTGGDLAGGDAATFFVTPPPVGTRRAVRIWVIGDSGTANADARAVRDAYLAFTDARPTDLWLMLGDNAYSSGTDAEYQAAVFDTYPSLLRTSVLWPALGNHDGVSADSATQSGPYYDAFTLPAAAEAGGVASGTEAYYSFDYANVHFVVLDSHESDRSPGGAMMIWLAADLAAADADWVIAFWHHPPYTRGSHNSDVEAPLVEMRENALPILEDSGVDLVLAGHSHSYERSFLLDGHYGTSATLDASMIVDGGDGDPAGDGAYAKATVGRGAHEGAVYAVAGSSGRIGGGALDHPAMVVSLNVLGSVVLDVDGDRLEATFLDSTGAVGDRFTVVKGPIFTDGFESGNTSAWSVVVGGS